MQDMPLLSYFLFRFFTFPLQYLPYKTLHSLGKVLGLLVYYFYPKYRKRALSNLALATDLHLSPDQIVETAKKSLQNLAITALEYPRLSREKKHPPLGHLSKPRACCFHHPIRTGSDFFLRASDQLGNSFLRRH